MWFMSHLHGTPQSSFPVLDPGHIRVTRGEPALFFWCEHVWQRPSSLSQVSWPWSLEAWISLAEQ